MGKRRATKNVNVGARKKKRLSAGKMLALDKIVRKQIRGPLIDHAEFLDDKTGLPK